MRRNNIQEGAVFSPGWRPGDLIVEVIVIWIFFLYDVLLISYFKDIVMEITKLSSKGQVILPAAIRAAKQWKAGVKFSVESTSAGVLLRPIKSDPATTLDEVIACTGYSGKTHSLADMDNAITAETKVRHARS